MARKDDELLQTGHRPAPGRNHERGTPRIIWAALLIAMIGAFLIFRSPGGSPSAPGPQAGGVTHAGRAGRLRAVTHAGHVVRA